jgi:ketosteroid isomerase-like protein
MAISMSSTLTAEDVAALRRLVEEEWTAAGLARDWDATLRVCAEDIVYMPSDQPALRGHAEFRQWLEQFPPIVKFEQTVERAEGHAGLAVVRATFAAAVEVGGERVENTGKALASFQKDPSGTWLVKAVCFNWDRPMPNAS